MAQIYGGGVQGKLTWSNGPGRTLGLVLGNKESGEVGTSGDEGK